MMQYLFEMNDASVTLIKKTMQYARLPMRTRANVKANERRNTAAFQSERTKKHGSLPKRTNEETRQPSKAKINLGTRQPSKAKINLGTRQPSKANKGFIMLNKSRYYSPSGCFKIENNLQI